MVHVRTLAFAPIVAVAFAFACAAPPSARTPSPPAAVARREGNVERRDYAGSAACAKCHADVYEAWSRTAMHEMTRLEDRAEIAAPFDGAALRFKTDTARLERHGARRFVRLESPRGGALFRVTKVLGGHHREDFVGVEVPAPDAEPAPGADELVLPVSFLRASGRLRYKGYSVMLRERPYLQAGPSWRQTCILCHNTAPYFTTLLGALTGRFVKRYQGAIVDSELPPERAWKYEVTDAAALDAAIDDELRALGAQAGGRGRAHVAKAIDATRERLGEPTLVELGVGCESCHGGARAHASNPSVKPSFLPRAPFLRITPEPTDAQAKTRACARCHQVLFSRYPWTWEGGRRHEDAGGSNISSGEARDFLLGGCASAMTCTACHDPHARSGAKLRAIDSPAGNAVCLRCHEKYRGDDALRAHAHHDPRGEAGVCIRCHMPQKNMALDSTLGRYHRIGSPTDPLRVLRDRPLECALCHADKSTESLVSMMEAWWKKRYDRATLRALYGDLDRPNLLPTLASGKPHEQAVALFLLGRARDKRAIVLAAKNTVNELPLVREYARAALEAMLGRSCGIDLGADAPSIERAARACLAAAGVDAPPDVWAKPAPDGDADPGED